MRSCLGFSLTQTLSVLGIIAILTSAGAYMLVDIIKTSESTACYITAQNIEKAEELYHLTHSKHTNEYISSEILTKNCELVKAGLLEMYDMSSCLYQWTGNKNNKHLVCLKCHEPQDNTDTLIELYNKYSRTQPKTKSELMETVIREYNFIKQKTN